MYSMENDDKMPSDFQSLKSYAGDAPQLFVCPSTGNTPGDFSDVDSWADYILVPGLSGSSPVDSIFVFSKPSCYANGGGNILYLDGSVQWCNPETYTKLTAGLQRKEM